MDIILLVTCVLLALIFSFLCFDPKADLLGITSSYIVGGRRCSLKLAAIRG